MRVCTVAGDLHLAANDADGRFVDEFTAITDASPRISSGPPPVMVALDVETSSWDEKNTFFMQRQHLRTTGMTWAVFATLARTCLGTCVMASAMMSCCQFPKMP